MEFASGDAGRRPATMITKFVLAAVAVTRSPAAQARAKETRSLPDVGRAACTCAAIPRRSPASMFCRKIHPNVDSRTSKAPAGLSCPAKTVLQSFSQGHRLTSNGA